MPFEQFEQEGQNLLSVGARMLCWMIMASALGASCPLGWGHPDQAAEAPAADVYISVLDVFGNSLPYQVGSFVS